MKTSSLKTTLKCLTNGNATLTCDFVVCHIGFTKCCRAAPWAPALGRRIGATTCREAPSLTTSAHLLIAHERIHVKGVLLTAPVDPVWLRHRASLAHAFSGNSRTGCVFTRSWFVWNRPIMLAKCCMLMVVRRSGYHLFFERCRPAASLTFTAGCWEVCRQKVCSASDVRRRSRQGPPRFQ